MKTIGIKTNAEIIHPVHSLIKFVRHISHKKLESKIMNFEESKKVLPENNELSVNFCGNSLLMNKKEALNFLDKKFKKDENKESIAKYESFQTSKGDINYLFLYKNYVSFQNDNEIIFANYGTPSRAVIVYKG